MDELVRAILRENYEAIIAEPLYAFVVKLVEVGLIIVVTLILVWLNKAVFKKIRGRQEDGRATQLVFLGQVVTGFLYVCGIIGIIYQFQTMRTVLYSVLAGSGVAALIIGFASQEAVSNIISGILITLFHPFKIGDFISMGANRGTIETITLRHIIIRTPENKRLVVPNSLINKEVIENANYIEDKVCNLIEFAIGFYANIDRVRAIIKEEAAGHRLFYDNGALDERGEPDLTVRVVRIESNCVVMCAYVWTRSPGDGFVLKCDLLEVVKKRLDAEKIDQPYSQRLSVEGRPQGFPGNPS